NHEWPIDPAAVGDGITIKLPEGVQYPTGAWDRPPFEGVIVPIPGATNEPVQGTMLFGLNPYRRRDEDVTDLARLIAGQVSGTLANVAALASEKRRADLIWSYSRDLMLVIEKDGTLRSASPAWTRILGHRLSDVIGHNLQEFVFE